MFPKTYFSLGGINPVNLDWSGGTWPSPEQLLPFPQEGVGTQNLLFCLVLMPIAKSYVLIGYGPRGLVLTALLLGNRHRE